jgi:hypothetical protein
MPKLALIMADAMSETVVTFAALFEFVAAAILLHRSLRDQ